MSALREDVLLAVAADAGRLDQHVLGLAAIGAGIHPQRAADGAGNAEEEFQPPMFAAAAVSATRLSSAAVPALTMSPCAVDLAESRAATGG